MAERSLERRFDAFRRDGDVAALGEVFDVLAPELLRVARRLAPNRTDAEDLVQATFLAAIERAESFDAGRALRPWLAGILVRQAGLARRRAGRTRALGEVARSAGERPIDALERRESAEALARAIERLTTAERDVLVPFLFEDKRAVEIARAISARPATVRMRVHRGLARLRRLVAASLGLGVIAAVLDRRALANVKREVMDMARNSITASSVSAAGAVSSPALLDGSLFASKLAIAALAVAAGTALLAVTRPWERRFEAQLASAASADDAPPPSASEVTMSTFAAPSASRAEPGASGSRSSAAQSPTPWVLKGRLIGLHSNEAAPTALKIEPRRRNGTLGDPRSVEVSGDGAFEVDVTSLVDGDAVHELILTADHPRYVVRKVKALVETAATVALPDGTSRREIVRDVEMKLAAIVRGSAGLAPDMAPAPIYAAIHRVESGVPGAVTEDSCACQANGEYRLRVASSADYLVVAWSDESAATTAPVATLVGAERVLPPLTLGAGLAIAGTVVSNGVPQPGVSVRARSEAPPAPPPSPEAAITMVGAISAFPSPHPLSPYRWTEHGFVRKSAEAKTDAQGRFTISGLGPVEYLVAANACAPPIALNAFDPRSAEGVPIIAPAEAVEIAASCAVIEFHLLDVAPGVSKVGIHAFPHTTGPPSEVSIGTAIGIDRAFAPVQRVGMAPGSTARIDFEIDGYESIGGEYAAPEAGTERIECLHFVPLALAKLTVRLTETGGEPIPQAAFGFIPIGPPGRSLFTREIESASGVYVLDAIRAGDYTVRIHTGGRYWEYSGYHLDAQFDVSLPRDAEESRALTLALGGRIRANLVAPDYALAKLFDATGAQRTIGFRGADGRMRTDSAGTLSRGANDTYPNLEPGEYRLEVAREPDAPLVIPVTVFAGRTSEVTVDTTLP